jgi:hypothetical protein
MPLWIAWFDAVRALRPAAKRFHTFLWMILVLVGLSCRPERAGVTSLVRLLGFGNRGYRRFLHLFHSHALDLDALTACWARLCLRLFEPVAVGERLVCLLAQLHEPRAPNHHRDNETEEPKLATGWVTLKKYAASPQHRAGCKANSFPSQGSKGEFFS